MYLTWQNVCATCHRKIDIDGTMVSGKDFCRNLRRFYLYRSQTGAEVEDHETVLATCSPYLRVTIANTIYADLLRGCPAFKTSPEARRCRLNTSG